MGTSQALETSMNGLENLPTPDLANQFTPFSTQLNVSHILKVLPLLFLPPPN